MIVSQDSLVLDDFGSFEEHWLFLKWDLSDIFLIMSLWEEDYGENLPFSSLNLLGTSYINE